MKKADRKRWLETRPSPDASDTAVTNDWLLSQGEAIPESDAAFPIISGIRMLTFALSTLSDWLSALGLQPAPQHIAAQLGVNLPTFTSRAAI